MNNDDLFSSVLIIVAEKLNFKQPLSFPALLLYHQPLNGLNSSVTLHTFNRGLVSVPCKAGPTANPAAQSKTLTDVVLKPAKFRMGN